MALRLIKPVVQGLERRASHLIQYFVFLVLKSVLK